MIWPTLGRREAHPHPFRAGQDAPTGAHGDRGRFPTDKDSRAYAGFLCTSSASAPDSVSTPHDPTISIIAHKGMRRYTPPQEAEACVEFFNFDEAYVKRLREGDPSTEQHFVAYFGQLLRIKLRSRTLTSDKVEDLSQETFIRVIANLRKDGGVRQPE